MSAAIDNLGLLQEIAFRRGSDFDVTLEITNADDTPYDATGHTITAKVVSRANPATKWDFVVTTSMLASGVVPMRLPDTVTETIPASPTSKMAQPLYDWYVDITLPDGTVYPYCYGPAYAF